ncbi:MAG: putative acyltransferase [Nocardioides sp.]|nr:putative acyltransferase [Nocardioides sp.]
MLVVLGHAGTVLWPTLVVGEQGPYGVPVLRGLLGGGAVIVFFVVGAFIVTLGLLRESARGTMDPARFLLRRLVRLGVQLVLLATALVLVQLLDPTAPGSMQGLVQNLGHVLTFTLNLLPLDHATPVRADVGHLWYLSVQQQCYPVLPLFVLAFARRRIVGALVLVGLISVVYLHRVEVFDEYGWVLASILTTTRSDGLFWGVLLALALPLLSRFRRWSWPLTIGALGALACQLAIQELPPFSYLGPWSLVYQLFIGLVVVAIWLQTTPSVVSRGLAVAPLTWLGRNSLTIYFWHLPVFFVVARHVGERPWWVGAALSFFVVAVLVVVLERVLEQPTRHLLATHPLFRRQVPRPDGGAA